MKKLFYVFAAVTLLSASSCGTKDYTCTCTETTSYSDNTPTVTTKPVVTVFNKASKHDASLYCISTTRTQDLGSTPVVTRTQKQECTLK